MLYSVILIVIIIMNDPGLQVIGIPDERSGQVPRAYIVREEGLTEEQVIQNLKEMGKFCHGLILTMVSFHDGNSLCDSEEILTEKQAVEC